MTSPDSNDDATSSKYHIHIGEGQGIVIGDNPHVEQHFYGFPSEQQVDLIAAEATYRQKVVEKYNRLDFSGFGTSDLFLEKVPLEEIFVRLTLTVEKRIPEPGSAEQSSPAGRDKSRQRERVIKVQEPIELAQALSNHLLIVGEPGAGKSILLRWLAVTFAEARQREPDRLGPVADADRLPVLVELGHLQDSYLKSVGGETPTWHQYLPEYLTDQQAFTNTPPELLTRALADGRCLLLFDGLDEIADRQVRAGIARSLAELPSHFPGNRVIIGSRPAGVSESEGVLHPLQFHRCQIERFTSENVQRFFHFWYALDRGLTPERQREDAEALYAKVQATPAIMQLATTPLLSTILVLIWRNERDLPERQVELYEHCCRVLIEHWETSHRVAYQGLLDKVGWECHLRLLAPLAYSIHSRRQISATRSELIPKLAEGLQKEGLCSNQDAAIREAELFLETLSLRSSLLQYTGTDESKHDRYGFPHLTFQEYLAARYIAAQPDPEYIDLVMEYLHEAWWQQVHLLTIAHLGSGKERASEASALILTILSVYSPPSWILRSSHNRWLRLIGPGKLLPQVQLDERTAWILAREFELAAKGYAECTLDSMTAIVDTTLSVQAAALVKHIVYDEARFKAQEGPLTVACQLPQRQGNEAMVSILLAALHNANEDVRLQATQILGQVGVGNEAVISALLVALDDTYSRVSERAVASLGQVGVSNETAISPLLTALHHTDWRVRVQAAQILGQVGVGNEAVISALLAALHDDDWRVRSRAADSLGQVGVSNEAVINALLAALHDDDWRVRSRAADSLRQVGVGNEAVINALLAALHDTDSDVRWQAAYMLGWVGVGNEAVISALLDALHDTDSRVRLRVAEILVRVGVGNEAVISALLDTLHDTDMSIQGKAAVSLGQIGVGNETVINALLVALHDADSGVRLRVAEILVQIGVGNETVINALLAALHDADWGVRAQSARILGQIGVDNEAVINALLDALHDAYWFVRKQVADSLGQVGVGNEAVINALLAALHDTDWHVRWLAVEILGQVGVGNEAVINALLATLHDADWLAQQPAADNLGQVEVDDDAVTSALMVDFQYTNSNMWSQVADSLGQIGVGNEAVINALLIALHDADSGVREQAVKILGQIGVGNEAVINALLIALHDADSGVREQAAQILGRVEIKDLFRLRRVLVALNRCLHDFDNSVRLAALVSIRQLLDGRPIPGYQWIPLRKRRLRHLGLKRVAFWLGMTALMVLIGLAATWWLGILNPNGFPMHFLVVLAGIIAFVASIAQVLGRTLRDPWNHSKEP